VAPRVALLAALLVAWPTLADAPAAWLDEPVELALKKAKDNRPELEKALTAVPKDQRPGMAFLVANMPDGDLTSLKADFLLTNTDLAYRARKEVPWGKDIPEDVFLNDVLPYVNVDERRDAWRKEFFELCLPVAKECKTPGEAAHKLNGFVFKKLNVKYSTERKAPNQSPKESIDQGKASCTGLSIVLADACRAVCIPARLAGTPLWANKRGNHTWVEVWDKGWHFTGACEPDPTGLDRGWFVGDAAQAKKDVPEHAIYAASFKKTDTHFPLVWALRNKTVPAENVTDRYAKAAPKPETVRVLIRVVDDSKKRVAVPVTVAGEKKLDGTSRGETADANDLLGFDLSPGKAYTVQAGVVEKKITTGKAGEQQVVEIVLPTR
jgi:Transglutaminase-like superfamily